MEEMNESGMLINQNRLKQTPKAIQFISLKSGKFEISPEAEGFFEKLEEMFASPNCSLTNFSFKITLRRVLGTERCVRRGQVSNREVILLKQSVIKQTSSDPRLRGGTHNQRMY
jgi:hypothetical protein